MSADPDYDSLPEVHDAPRWRPRQPQWDPQPTYDSLAEPGAEPDLIPLAEAIAEIRRSFPDTVRVVRRGLQIPLAVRIAMIEARDCSGMVLARCVMEQNDEGRWQVRKRKTPG